MKTRNFNLFVGLWLLAISLINYIQEEYFWYLITIAVAFINIGIGVILGEDDE